MESRYAVGGLQLVLHQFGGAYLHKSIDEGKQESYLRPCKACIMLKDILPIFSIFWGRYIEV